MQTALKAPSQAYPHFNPEKNHDSQQSIIVQINGLVQGVGFRPHVYRAAEHNKITGFVNNVTDGVFIKANGHTENLNNFITEIIDKAPLVAEIEKLTIHPAWQNGEQAFQILPSKKSDSTITEISPDIAVCPDCLEDMEKQAHRIHYPFVNCTNCGPRFSIIRDIPYDRQNTSMSGFKMCKPCADEFHNILNRRFHAQPIACNECGPEYALLLPNGQPIACVNLPEKTAQLIDQGFIVAIKGMGGFHLACNALDAKAVSRLRNVKLRDGKPFAVMCPSVEALGKYAEMTGSELETLLSWRRPIVLLRSKKTLPEILNASLNKIGAMLPYMPFHYLLFKYLSTTAIVLTSGNLSEEPIIINKQQAVIKLGKICDYLVDYNRDIVNRVDDSVVHLVGDQVQIIRRSRGYAPRSISLSMNVEGIFATGSELKNCFAIGKANKAILSQHIGDLKNLETFSCFCETFEKTKRLFQFEPELIATDLHPDFMTADWSQKQHLAVEHIQHHHAHIASAMAEHQIRETVLGVCFDGTGYGSDGHTWGSEFMQCDLTQYSRLGHFEYMPMPGGDLAIKEPWRMALGCLFKVYGDKIPDSILARLPGSDPHMTNMVLTALTKNINIIMTSGMGRLFDAVASLLDLCHFATYEAEGPMKLEACIDPNIRESYPVILKNNGTITIDPIIEGIIADLKNNARIEKISTRFHNTIVEATINAIRVFQPLGGCKKVILSGGSFQNAYLLSQTIMKLRALGMQVLTNIQVPANDGGVALGQMAVAAARRPGFE